MLAFCRIPWRENLLAGGAVKTNLGLLLLAVKLKHKTATADAAHELTAIECPTLFFQALEYKYGPFLSLFPLEKKCWG